MLFCKYEHAVNVFKFNELVGDDATGVTGTNIKYDNEVYPMYMEQFHDEDAKLPLIVAIKMILEAFEGTDNTKLVLYKVLL
jgi:hypothetical protein